MTKKRGKVRNKDQKGHSKGKSHGKTILIVILVLMILIIVFIFLFKGNGGKYSQEQIDSLAKCLTEKGAVMYGAFWCPHCARTKARFGSAFKYIQYVECDPRGDNEQSELCIQKQIENYDTWEFTNGERLVGEPSFEAMAEKSGCSIEGN